MNLAILYFLAYRKHETLTSLRGYVTEKLLVTEPNSSNQYYQKPLLEPILSQFNPAHCLTTCFHNTYIHQSPVLALKESPSKKFPIKIVCLFPITTFKLISSPP